MAWNCGDYFKQRYTLERFWMWNSERKTKRSCERMMSRSVFLAEADTIRWFYRTNCNQVENILRPLKKMSALSCLQSCSYHNQIYIYYIFYARSCVVIHSASFPPPSFWKVACGESTYLCTRSLSLQLAASAFSLRLMLLQCCYY